MTGRPVVTVALVALALATLLVACAEPEDEPRTPSPVATPETIPEATATLTARPTPEPTPTPAAEPGTYLALGDSLAVGVGATQPAQTGYVALIAEALSAPDAVPPVATLRNLAVSGETSASMIERGQLDRAIGVIEAADPPITLVTLDIGGNDLLALLRTPECSNDPQGASCMQRLDRTLAGFEENYRRIVEALTDTLDEHAPGAHLAVMTYFNPFSGTDAQYEAAGELALLGTDAAVACEATAREEQGMNDVIVCAGLELGAIPVDVQPRFAGLGLELTHIGAQDIHANDEGYAVIADQFLTALREAR